MRPSREKFRQSEQTYFVTFQTARRQCFFRKERWANLFLEVLQAYGKTFALHDFAIMPDHIHLPVSPQNPLEKVVQLLKGGYSYRAKRAFNWSGDIWQVGFTDHRIRHERDWDHHVDYIAKNVGVLKVESHPYCGTASGLKLQQCPQWLKPLSPAQLVGGSEDPPFQN